jgi:indoleamine 2,3-dioxygenase
MPSTPLTTILKDFRSYRPGNHRAFLSHVADLSLSVNFKTYALAESSSALRYLRLLDQVRDFRYRHWCFTREYILKKTAHPTATGGSPIVTWLPNQLVAVLDAMTGAGEGQALKGVAGKTGEEVQGMLERAERQRDGLKKEVEKWCSDRGVPAPERGVAVSPAVAAH